MAEFMDIIQFKETSTGKTFAVKLGSASQAQDGSWFLDFDALPIPQLDKNGKLRVSCKIAPRRQQQGASVRQLPPRPAAKPRDDFEDETPFD
jgi:hypothetical protein